MVVASESGLVSVPNSSESLSSIHCPLVTDVQVSAGRPENGKARGSGRDTDSKKAKMTEKKDLVAWDQYEWREDCTGHFPDPAT